MIVFDEFLTQVIHVSLAENEKVIQALLLQGLNESLDERILIRRTETRFKRFDPLRFQRLHEALAEFRVAIVHQDFGFHSFGFDVRFEFIGLADHPGFVRVIGRFRSENLTRFEVQENQNENVFQPFGR